jgi:hypothetical protein
VNMQGRGPTCGSMHTSWALPELRAAATGPPQLRCCSLNSQCPCKHTSQLQRIPTSSSCKLTCKLKRAHDLMCKRTAVRRLTNMVRVAAS